MTILASSSGERALASRRRRRTRMLGSGAWRNKRAFHRRGWSSPTKKPNPEHLARYAIADLFLDTFPYGAHTTAADAMWMGVPILTTPGRSFASRVCASLAHAGGIGELVCPTQEVYVARAIELGRNPKKISELKERLTVARQSSALFDTPRLVRELENLYRGMWEEFQAGRRPVPDLIQLGCLPRDRGGAGARKRVSFNARRLSSALSRQVGDAQLHKSDQSRRSIVERRRVTTLWSPPTKRGG